MHYRHSLIYAVDMGTVGTHKKNVEGENCINQGYLSTIHLRRQHDLGGEGYPQVPMVKRSQYIRIENPLHKHFAGMPMVVGVKNRENLPSLKWMVP